MEKSPANTPLRWFVLRQYKAILKARENALALAVSDFDRRLAQNSIDFWTGRVAFVSAMSDDGYAAYTKRYPTGKQRGR